VESPRCVFHLNSLLHWSINCTFQFLDDLGEKLKPVGAKEREILLAIKKEEHEKLGLPFDGEFYIWDYRYYDRKFIEQSLDLDDSLVKEYFPVAVVVPTILEIYQKLLGVQFVEHKGKTWHPGKTSQSSKLLFY
jgi:Zn-dependent oligopeptidase